MAVDGSEEVFKCRIYQALVRVHDDKCSKCMCVLTYQNDSQVVSWILLDTRGTKRSKTCSLFLRSSHLMGQTDQPCKDKYRKCESAEPYEHT